MRVNKEYLQVGQQNMARFIIIVDRFETRINKSSTILKKIYIYIN